LIHLLVLTGRAIFARLLLRGGLLSRAGRRHGALELGQIMP